MKNEIGDRLRQESDKILAARRLLEKETVRIYEINKYYYIEMPTAELREVIEKYISKVRANLERNMSEFKDEFMKDK